MKELSIEEKARYYDKAIAHAKKVLKIIGNATLGNLVLKNEFENMFPELAESEDERIRKALIDGFTVMKESKNCGKTFSNYNIPITDIINWLEKQGEHVDFLSKIQVGDKVTRNENGVLVNLSQLERIAKKQGGQNTNLPSFDEAQGTPIVKQGEQSKKHDVCNTCDEKDSCISPCCIKLVEKQGEQKPAEWSEEDERKIGDIRDAITLDDELEEFCKEELYDFLKSLRPQNRWKPSADQLAALFCAIPYIHCSSTRACACSLYKDLKKLMEI